MPDRTSHTEFESAKVHIAPAKCQKFAHAKSCAGVEQNQGSFPDSQLAQQQLKLEQLKNIWNTLTLCTLTNELDRIFVRPFVSHCVCEQCAHEVPNLGPCAFRPLDPVQPIFDCNGLHLVERVISPTRKNPVLQIGFVSRSCRERFSTVTIAIFVPT